MRYALAAAALAAGAVAVPYHNRRDVVIDYDYVTVTNVVTVTAGAEPSSVAVAADAATSSSTSSSHWGHHWHSQSSAASSAASVSVSSYQASATPTSTYVAPAPTSTYVAPTTTSKAPSSTWVTSTVSPSPAYSAPASSAAASSAPASSAPAPSADASAPKDYAGQVKYHHNLHRSNHSAPDVEWDASLASTAATIASSCVYAHNVAADGGGYGQNIAAGVQANNISAIITDLFYNGEVGWYNNLYDAAQPDMTNFEKWGHFSQIVWVGTKKVGCATQYCPGGLKNVGTNVSPYFTVCNYGPPGNYANEYKTNVLRPKGLATAQWNAGSS